MSSQQQYNAFWARDAFSYVDSYRRHLSLTEGQISNELRRLEEQLWNRSSTKLDSSMLAKLRGIEHALRQVVSHEEPGLVLLIEGSPDDAVKKLQKAEEERNNAIRSRDIQLNEAREEILQLRAELEESQKDNHFNQQRFTRLQRKVNEMRATVTIVIGMGLAAVAVMALLLIFAR